MQLESSRGMGADCLCGGEIEGVIPHSGVLSKVRNWIKAI